VVTWTSDLGTRWTTGWPGWDQNAQFWEQMTRWAMGPPIDRDFKIDVARSGTDAKVTVEDLQDGAYADLQPLTLTLTAPGGVSARVPLRQVAAGQYTATIGASAPGAYQVDVAEAPAPRKTARSETNGFVVPPVAETASFVANDQVLRRIASETGGQVLDSGSTDLYSADRTASAARWDPVWAIFALIGLGAFILDVAVRRLRPSTLRALVGLRPTGQTFPH
jgi:hypothetical protein